MLTLIGLVLTLAGATLLFFYGLPRKKIGNVIVQGVTAMKVKPEPGESNVPDSEWQTKANRFLKRSKIFNSTGFGLVVVGTLFQILGLYFYV